MNRLLITAALALTLCAASPAQQPIEHDRAMYPPPNYGIRHVTEHTMDDLIVAREKLIRHYVLAEPRLAWGVSICGDDDVFTNEPASWLTIYVYSDTLEAFALDYDKFATQTPQHTMQVDGITVVVEVIKRKSKGEANEQPKTERNDRQPVPKNGRSQSVVSGRPSRA